MNTIQSSKKPKYWKLAEQFREEMKSGVLRPGDRLPSLAEMREQKGVSRPTMEKVHQILEGEGLIQRLPGSGTYVLEPPSRIANGILGLTGFGFQFGTRSSYWANLLGGIRDAALANDTQILLLDHRSTKGWEKADGVLLCDWSSEQTLQHVPVALPCVSLLVPVPGMASVVIDERAAMKTATAHLIELGHEKIAYLHGNDGMITPQRVAGYGDAMKEAGLKPHSKWRRGFTHGNDFGEQFISAGKIAVEKWLEEDWSALGCTALLCHNDEVAAGACEALRAKGVLVARDVSVVGFDGLEIGAYMLPRLTSIEVPLREIGTKAVEVLLQQIKADKVMAQHQILNTHLRVRESTATPPRHL